jgi:hypothetical protein
MLTPKQIEIRRAVPPDAAAIAAVLHTAFIEFKPLYIEGGFAATALNTAEVLARMTEGPVWVALSKDEIVAPSPRFRNVLRSTCAAWPFYPWREVRELGGCGSMKSSASPAIQMACGSS